MCVELLHTYTHFFFVRVQTPEEATDLHSTSYSLHSLCSCIRLFLTNPLSSPSNLCIERNTVQAVKFNLQVGSSQCLDWCVVFFMPTHYIILFN